MHPTTHHFYFILLVSHSAGWLNRIMSPDDNYQSELWSKKMKADEIAYQDVKQEKDPKKK